MMRRIVLGYFSPCKNVEKSVTILGKALAEELMLPIEICDFTRKEDRERTYQFAKEDLVIIGMPVYAGRLPNLLLPFLKEHILGDNTKGIALVSYGNRSMDHALAELSELMHQQGFSMLGACSVVSEHSFAKELATGRPNEEDALVIREFSKVIIDRLARSENHEKTERHSFSEEELLASLPGERNPSAYYIPLMENGEPAKFLKAVSKVMPDRCSDCGKCAAVCPLSSIEENNPWSCTGICMKCQACIHVCEKNARYFDDEAFLSHQKMLVMNYKEEKKTRYW